MELSLKWLVVLFCLSQLCSRSSASFVYGHPCSDFNTAYLHPTEWIMPKGEINCVDISNSDNPDPFIHSAFFQMGQKADTLYADHMNLTTFPSAVINALPDLEMLDLSGNGIRKVPFKLYKLLPKVTKVLLTDNDVYIPKRRAFFKSVTIRMLMLTRNKIGHVYPITFSKMPNLEILYLDGNRLKHIYVETFWVLKKLVYLHLGSNAMVKIPPKDLMPSSLRFYIADRQKVK